MNRKQARENAKNLQRLKIAPDRLKNEGRPMSPAEVGFQEALKAHKKAKRKKEKDGLHVLPVA